MFITFRRLNPTGSLQQAREANVNASKSLESSKAVSGNEKTKQHTGFGKYGGLKNLTRIQAAVCPLLLCNFVIVFLRRLLRNKSGLTRQRSRGRSDASPPTTPPHTKPRPLIVTVHVQYVLQRFVHLRRALCLAWQTFYEQL